MDKLSKELGLDVPALFADYRPIPATAEQFALTEKLTWYAASMALERHLSAPREAMQYQRSSRTSSLSAFGKSSLPELLMPRSWSMIVFRLIQITPEPVAKRTVEGDLGVYVNARSLAEQVGMDKLSNDE